MPNIKFNYLYRDSANYKKYGAVIFANPTNIDLYELETLIKSKLIDFTWFYVHEWNVPDLHFDIWDNKVDHSWHEFVNVEYTEEKANDSYFLEEFKHSLLATPWRF